MSESTDIKLLHRAWEAMSVRGDLSVLEGALDPEAQWLGVEDGQICENRKMILKVMKRNLTVGFAGRIEETVEVGGRIVVAFRPDHPRDDGRPLDQGVAYVVVTMHNGRVIELKGCADRAAAMTYAQTGTVPPMTAPLGPRSRQAQ
jgi:ketosteroid isomerase-like protein